MSGLLLTLAGCSTAPIADFMDAVSPGGPRRDPPARNKPLPPPRQRDPADPFPPPAPRRDGPPSRPRDPADPFPPPAPRRDDPPPLPPVPTGYSPPPPIEGDE